MTDDPLEALRRLSEDARKGSKSRSELQGPSDDPLAGVEAVLYCSVHACEFGTCGGGEEHQKVRLLPESAVRKAMVEWLRNGPHVMGKTWSERGVRNELADRLERGEG